MVTRKVLKIKREELPKAVGVKKQFDLEEFVQLSRKVKKIIEKEDKEEQSKYGRDRFPSWL